MTQKKTFWELVEDHGIPQMAEKLDFSREYIRLVACGQRAVSRELARRCSDKFGAAFDVERSILGAPSDLGVPDGAE